MSERTPVNHWEYDAQQARNSITGLGNSMGELVGSLASLGSLVSQERALEAERNRLIEEHKAEKRAKQAVLDRKDRQIRELYRNLLARYFGICPGGDYATIRDFCSRFDFESEHFENIYMVQSMFLQIRGVVLDENSRNTYLKVEREILTILNPDELAAIPAEHLENFTREQLSYLREIDVPWNCPMGQFKVQLFGRRSMQSRMNEAQHRSRDYSSNSSSHHSQEEVGCCRI